MYILKILGSKLETNNIGYLFVRIGTWQIKEG